MTHLPGEVVETIIGNLTSNRDRNSASLVNKLWYQVDRYSRRAVSVSNCYAVSPARVIARFPNLRSLSLIGKPWIPVPNDWGGSADPWLNSMAKDCPLLEELRLKRMNVSDQNLEAISNCFPNFKSLILNSCNGFTVAGLSAIASNCSFLERLELVKSDVTDSSGEWLGSFPETSTSLVSLNFSCIKGLVNLTYLEKLVARCPRLTSLTLNKTVPHNMIRRILLKAPRLTHFGLGSTMQQLEILSYIQLSSAFRTCDSIQSLSLFHHVHPMFLRAINPTCSNLVFLNMRHAAHIQGSDLIKVIKGCTKLRRLWMRDCIGDEGLEVVSCTCKNLEELRVFRCDAHGANTGLTEKGLTAISAGCQRLKSLTYFCDQMTNAALITFSKNCPNITCFRLHISTPKLPDRTTLQPLDNGFGAIVQSCKNLRKLTLSGLLTDQVFLYIGMYAERLEVFSASNAGESDAGMHYLFNGCKNLRKVAITECPFGDAALLADMFGYESMRSLWMSACEITLGGCKVVARRTVSLNVEIINENDDETEDYPDDGMMVEKVFVYQTVAGPRADAPGRIWTL